MKDLLMEEYQRELEILEDMTAGTDEYVKQAKIVSDIAERYTAFVKIEADERIKAADREAEVKLKEKQMETDADLKREQAERDAAMRREEAKIDRRDRTVKNIMTGVKIGGGGVLIIGLAACSFYFEEKGTITNPIGKGIINMVVRFLG